MKQNLIHLAIQIVPLRTIEHPYTVIDKAIDVIAQSGLKYYVGPMETVIVGTYDEVWHVAKKAQEACLNHGADELVVTIKLHIKKDQDIDWEEKMGKYL